MIPVIDLFAGPGGLAEGFASFRSSTHSQIPFKIVLSIEKDLYAHKTLELRSFFRQFPTTAPEEYYRYLRNDGITREQLFNAHPEQALLAREEARRAELGGLQDVEITDWIRKVLERSASQHSVLIGGPPCQAYSLVGRSSRRADPTFEADVKHTLYREYVRLLARFQPSVFVMENVKGILSSKLKGEELFQLILNDMRYPHRANYNQQQDQKSEYIQNKMLSYNIYSLVIRCDTPENLHPTDFVIRSEEYGIPQSRHRVVLLGVRSDITKVPQVLLPHQSKISTYSVLNDLPALRSSLSQRMDKKELPKSKCWGGVISDILEQDWFHKLRSNSPSLIREDVEQLVARIQYAIENLKTHLETGREFMPSSGCPQYRSEWFYDPLLGGVCNHVSRSHMTEDLHRYLYAACYAQVYGVSPKLRDYPEELLPLHKNIQKDRDAGISDSFCDRFRVQTANKPATTILSHIHKDGHSVIHYDPTQCRSLTVREAARLQTFPDNYFFEGPRTQQYLQVGNAVPPLLAKQIAEVVYDLLV